MQSLENEKLTESQQDTSYQAPRIADLGKTHNMIRGHYTYGWKDQREGFYSTGE